MEGAMKKLELVLTVIMLVFAVAYGVSAEPSAAVKASVLVEAATGQVISENGGDEKLQAASIVKLMSMLLWAEDIEAGKYSLSDSVTTTPHAAEMSGSSIWLKSGDVVDVETLLKSVAIANANDACVSMAEFAAGNEEAFVKRMNKRAAELGMKNTSYTNSAGFDDENQYTTAYDTALLMRELLKHDDYDEYNFTWMDYVRDGTAQLVNTNRMVRYYDGLVGGKVGATKAAGACVAVAAKRNGMTLIAVTLGGKGGETQYDTAEELLDSGFAAFQLYSLELDSEKLAPIKVNGGVVPTVGIKVEIQGNSVINKGKAKSIEYEYSIADELEAPVQAGQRVGTVKATLDGKEIFTSPVVTVSEVERLTFMRGMLMLLQSLFRL